MVKILLAFLAISSNAHARIGFSMGDRLVATPIQGQVRVVCDGFNGSGTAQYNCRDVVLSPNPYDYFVGPQVSSDFGNERVELVATHEDGTVRVKSASYDAPRGKSREAFNLWISTIFQKPLLGYGTNNVRYKIYTAERTSEIQSEGLFVVTVQKSAGRTCPSVEYTSTDYNDCNSQYSICQRYFDQYKYCQ